MLQLLISSSLILFLKSAFAVDLAGITKLFFLNVSETSFLHLISRVLKSYLYYC